MAEYGIRAQRGQARRDPTHGVRHVDILDDDRERPVAPRVVQDAVELAESRIRALLRPEAVIGGVRRAVRRDYPEVSRCAVLPLIKCA